MKRIDFEHGTVTGNILGAALPMLVAQILSLLYNIVDRVYIARIPEVGTAALGAVGLCFPLIVIITAFSNLFGSGGAPLFSIERGKNDQKKAERIMNTSYSMVCVCAVILMVTGFLFARPLLSLFGASADRDKAVGQLHDKSRGTEADNIFRIACTLRNFIFPHKAHFQFRFPGQEIQNEHCGKCLGNHSCNRSPLHTKAKYKDKQRVKQQVCDRSDRDGKHTNGRVALRVDERVHAGCHHRRQSSDQINHHIEYAMLY